MKHGVSVLSLLLSIPLPVQERNFMGEISNTMNHFFEDNRRFADLFNGACFQGRSIVSPENLMEMSEVYRQPEAEKPKTGQRRKRAERIRDVCKTLKTGEVLRILALENQDYVDYTMPFRCMQYDTMEYGKQLDRLRKQNRQEKKLIGKAERLCGIRKTDRLVPVYTLCLYHGMEKWDGPRSLRDMMRFEKGNDFQELFGDYPFRLYCLNEIKDLGVFHTEVRSLFRVLQFREDREEMRQLLQEDEEYRQLDADTLEVMAVVLDMPKLWENRRQYLIDEKEEYAMCKAMREWAAEERRLGREEGREEGLFTVVKNLLSRGMSDMDIIAIAECDHEFVVKVRESCV